MREATNTTLRRYGMHIRLSAEELAALDGWIAAHPRGDRLGTHTRPGAVRFLMLRAMKEQAA